MSIAIEAVKTTVDAYRETRQERAVFSRVRLAERGYSIQLRKIAQHIDDIIRAMRPDSIADMDTLQRMLERYADILRPWAQATAGRMLAEVERRDTRAWVSYARLMGAELEHEIRRAPTGEALARLLDQQVDLITSLPREAALRVHQLTTNNLYGGSRASEVAKQILLTGQVTKARANLIARTETSRTATALAQARAEHIGSPGYIWRNSQDYKVRPELGIKHFAQLNTLAMGSHRKLEGTFHRWDTPPIAGTRGERAHPGGIYNCRCYPEPVIPNGY
jgi:SPP1 gp7 family putative phage head morphogenesis protein